MHTLLAFLLFFVGNSRATTPVFYDLAMGTAGSQITHFSATFQVPSLARSAGFHAIWPGLFVDKGTFILQNVVDDQQGTTGTGKWQFAPWYGPDGSPGLGYHQYTNDIVSVQPGDTVLSTFSLVKTTASSATWTSSWSINGASGSVSSTLSQTNSNDPFSSAGLFIELRSGAQWDFGSVEWSDVAITVATNDSSWCSASGWSTKGYGSAPVVSFLSAGVLTSGGGGSTTCTFESIIFDSA